MPGCRRRKAHRKHVLPLRRRDLVTRFLVDIGVNYEPVLGQAGAMDFLRQQMVPEHVIQRVFLTPQYRR
ncbi:hypothetical protein ACO0K2_14305 [Undibacterium sp. MH2W]|uniref:hypothetical protein n=1 Tax=Undibacterium sp. MH2W TaxID=3413044 RepID=UPI003BF107B4